MPRISCAGVIFHINSVSECVKIWKAWISLFIDNIKYLIQYEYTIDD